MLMFLFFIAISCSPIKGNYYTKNDKEVPDNLVRVTKIIKNSKLIHETTRNSAIDAYNKNLIDKNDVQAIIEILNTYSEVHNKLTTETQKWLRFVDNDGIYTDKEYVYKLINSLIIKNRTLKQIIQDETEIYVPETLFESIFNLYRTIQKEN